MSSLKSLSANSPLMFSNTRWKIIAGCHKVVHRGPAEKELETYLICTPPKLAKTRSFPVEYVEDLFEARMKLGTFFSIPL